MSSLRLPREHVVGSDGLHCHASELREVTMGNAYSRYMSFRKMKDVELISADFDGEQRLFRASTWVFLEYPHHATYYGAFKLDMDYEPAAEMPILCLRKAQWKEQEARDLTRRGRMDQVYAVGWVSAELLFVLPAYATHMLKLLPSSVSVAAESPACGSSYLDGPLGVTTYLSLGGEYVERHCHSGATIPRTKASWIEALSSEIDTLLGRSGDVGCLPADEVRISYRPSLYMDLWTGESIPPENP